ncbi:MAG TPA: glutamate-5-semialdehyde dehydrogenase [Planctomycetota bacterium]|nr:glutamate-5-semialdehyde dehydrogenase [Planctomycetota bacterium]
MSDIAKDMLTLAKEARQAARILSTATTQQKNDALQYATEALMKERGAIEAANAEDIARGKEKGLAGPMLDRLKLDARVIERLAEGLQQVIALPDPVGREISRSVRPNGLVLRRVRVPIGAILIIFESRPNVTVEAASLCLKSGNSAILRGGSEAISSNRALAKVLRGALAKAGLPAAAISVVETTDRAAINELLKLEGLIDLVIPRGGESLIRMVAENSLIPTIKHYKGVCHVYVDEDADLDLAKTITLNSKLQRVSVCNAAETLLVNSKVAAKFLPDVGRLLLEKNCEMRVCPTSRKALLEAGVSSPLIKDADEATYDNEYLDRVISVKVVESLQSAADHIERHGSRHTETIVTGSPARGKLFQDIVDSSCVFVNASTRLNDGFEFGLGAEIGISTDKLHARGPMGLEELTTYKWLGDGTGQLRT